MAIAARLWITGRSAHIDVSKGSTRTFVMNTISRNGLEERLVVTHEGVLFKRS